jgi:hypothetical protein
VLQWATSGNLVKKKKEEKREKDPAIEGTTTRESEIDVFLFIKILDWVATVLPKDEDV